MHESEIIAIKLFLGTILLVYVLEFVILIKYLYCRLRKIKNRIGIFSKIIHGLSILGVLFFLYGYYIESYWVEVNNVNIKTPKLKNSYLKIVQFSDLHCDEKIRNEKRVVSIVNRLKPDIIVFTGDTLNTPKALNNFKSLMRGLYAKIDKFAVKGNFDVWYWENIGLFDNTDFIVLDKDIKTINLNGEKIAIAGLGCKYSDDSNLIFEQLSSSSFNIFLYHYPDLVENTEDYPIDLYLSGHKHGGQVALPFYGALITLSKHGKKYESGLYIINNTILYVNRGIGMEGGFIPRVRFWSRPEITIFNISPE